MGHILYSGISPHTLKPQVPPSQGSVSLQHCDLCVLPPCCRPQNLDIKLIQAKHQQAEMRRNRKEEDLRENHPFFDRPLFAVPRESKFRRVCRSLVNARYDAQLKNAATGKERKVISYKG